MTRDYSWSSPHHPKRIYIAASSKDVQRAARMSKLLQAGGLEITSSWIMLIDQGEVPNDPTVSKEEHLRRANRNADELTASDLLWLLVPGAPLYSEGASWEQGHADALKKIVIASGAPSDLRRCIFTARARTEFEDDMLAFAHICYLARAGVKY